MMSMTKDHLIGSLFLILGFILGLNGILGDFPKSLLDISIIVFFHQKFRGRPLKELYLVEVRPLLPGLVCIAIYISWDIWLN